MLSQASQIRRNRSGERAAGGALGFLALVAVLTLGILGGFLEGCGSGDPVAPDDILTSWDELAYETADGPATVQVGSSGAIVVVAGVPGERREGLLGPATWRALETALAAADLQPMVSHCGEGVPAAGQLTVWRGGQRLGFRWCAEDQLRAAERDVIAVLEQIRSESEGSPQLELYRTQRLLHGCDASGDAGAVIIRDEDQLLDLLRRRLSRETVVMPPIDFSREMVLAVFLGPRSNEAFDVQVGEYVTRTVDGFLQVPVDRHRYVGQECPAVQEVLGAFDLVKLLKTDTQLFLRWATYDHSCEQL